MPLQYFKAFPIIDYTLTNDSSDAKSIVDITKRIGIREDFKSSVNSYYRESVSDSQTPEQVSLSAYNNPYNHWILMHTNSVVDPYFDWVLDGKKFDDYILKKYPDNVLILAETGNNFIVGETITGTISGTTAIVKDSQVDLGQIVYESASGPWTTSPSPETVRGSLSTEIGSSTLLEVTIQSTVKEYAAPKFYEVVRDNEDGTESRLIVNKGFTTDQREALPGGTGSWDVPIAVDNATYESRINEENRIIKILNPELVEMFEEEFEEKIQ